MNKKLTQRLIFFIIGIIIVIPFLSGEYLIYLSLITSLILFYLSIKSLLIKIQAINLALLGYSVMSFFDIYKNSFIDNDVFKENYINYLTIFLIYLGFLIFLLSYRFTKNSKPVSLTSVNLSRIKLFKIWTPIGLLLLIYLNIYSISGPIGLLLSFIPKSLAVIYFYLLLATRKKIYIIFTIIFIVFSFDEISRRIYFTLFFIFIPIVLSYLHLRYRKIKGSHKALFIFTFLAIFLFMNYIRSDFEFGEGYVEGDKIASTLNYMKQFKAIDTFANTAFVIENFPDNYDYYYGETYFAIFVQFIPRAIWEDKPVGFGAPLGLLRKAGIREFNNDVWLNEVNGFSYSPGFIGEAYANFGVLGIIILSMFFGIACKIYDFKINVFDVIKDINLLPYLSFLGSFFLLLRGDALMALYFSILFYMFLKIIINFSKKNGSL